VDDPVLVLVSAWIALAAEDPAELNRWLAVAEQLRWTGPLPDGTPSLEVGIASLPRPSHLLQARGRFPQGCSLAGRNLGLIADRITPTITPSG
jgi:hypothetical protein